MPAHLGDRLHDPVAHRADLHDDIVPGLRRVLFLGNRFASLRMVESTTCTTMLIAVLPCQWVAAGRNHLINRKAFSKRTTSDGLNSKRVAIC